MDYMNTVTPYKKISDREAKDAFVGLRQYYTKKGDPKVMLGGLVDVVSFEEFVGGPTAEEVALRSNKLRKWKILGWVLLAVAIAVTLTVVLYFTLRPKPKIDVTLLPYACCDGSDTPCEADSMCGGAACVSNTCDKKVAPAAPDASWNGTWKGASDNKTVQELVVSQGKYSASGVCQGKPCEWGNASRVQQFSDKLFLGWPEINMSLELTQAASGKTKTATIKDSSDKLQLAV